MKDLEGFSASSSAQEGGRVSAERRAFILEWVARNQRSLGAGVGTALLLAPLGLIAQVAAPAGFVPASGLEGVASVSVTPQGVAQITLANGQTVAVAAQSVQVVGGQVFITQAAASAVAQAAAAAAGVGAGLGAGGAVAGGVAAAGLVAVAGQESPPVATIFIPVIAENDLLGAADLDLPLTISGTSQLIADDTDLRVTVAGRSYDTTISDNAWSVTIPALDVGDFPRGPAEPLDILVEALNDAGDPTVIATRTITVDTVAPSIDIDPITGDNTINIAERAEGFTVTGTSDAGEGQEVTVSIDGTEVGTGLVGADGTWSVSIDSADLAGLSDGDTPSFTAAVRDPAGNEGSVGRDPAVDLSVPTVDINTVAGDDRINIAEQGTGFALTGTATGADGQEVTVTLDGVVLGTDIVSGGTWSLDITPAMLAGLTDQVDVTFEANVSNTVGNPALTASATVTPFLAEPVIFIADDTVAGDNVINIAEQGAGFQISGSASLFLEGRPFTVSLNGVALDGVSFGPATGAWTFDVTPAHLAGLDNGDTAVFTVAISDAAGNEASATVETVVNMDRPTFTFDEPVAGTGFINIADQAEGITVSGTSSGQHPPLGFILRVAGEDLEVAIEPSGDWSREIPPLLLAGADGDTITFEVIAQNTVGNPPLPTSVSATIDITTPTIAIDAIAGNDIITLANQGSDFTITGTTSAENDQVVTVMFQGVAYTGDVSGGTWSVTIPQAVMDALDTDLAFDVTASVRSFADNPSLVASRPVTTDFSGPSLTIDEVAGGFINFADRANDDGVTISGSSSNLEEGTVVSVNITDFGGTDIDLTATIDSAGNWSTTLLKSQVETLSDFSTYTVTASATDGEGTPTPPVERTFETRFTSPDVAINVIAGDDVINIEERDAGVTVTGTSDLPEGTSVLVRLAIATFEGFTPIESASGNVDAAGDFAAFFTPEQLAGIPPDGTFRFTASATDPAGNPGSAIRDGTADYIAPTLGIDPLPFGDVLNDAELTAGFTITGTSDAEGRNVSVSINQGGSSFVTLGPITVTDGVWSVSFSSGIGLEDGTATVDASITDPAGNRTEVSQGFDIDLTPPVVTVNAPPFGEFLNIDDAAGEIVVTGTVEGNDGNPVTVSIGGVEAAVVIDGTNWTATFAPGALSAITEGPTNVVAVAADDAGNTIAANSVPFTVDLTPPTISIDPLPDGGVFDATTGDLLISGTTVGAEDGQTVTVSLGAATATGTVNGDVWTATIPGTAVGALTPGIAGTISATVSDRAGNETATPAEADVFSYVGARYILSPQSIVGDDIVLTIGFDARFTLPGDGGVNLGEEVRFDTDVITYLAPPNPVFAAGLIVEPVDVDEAATGVLVFGGIGLFVSPSATPVTYSMRIQDTGEVAMLDVFPDTAGRYSLQIGTAGDDTLTAGPIDTVLFGQAGNDTLDVSAGGVHTVVFNLDSTANGVDEVIGFSLAETSALPDRIAFFGLDNSTLRGSGVNAEMLPSTATTVGADTGLIVLTSLIDISDAAERMSAVDALDLAPNDAVFVIMGDGADAMLLRVEINFDGSETSLDHMADFRGITNLNDFGQANLLDFELIPPPPV